MKKRKILSTFIALTTVLGTGSCGGSTSTATSVSDTTANTTSAAETVDQTSETSAVDTTEALTESTTVEETTTNSIYPIASPEDNAELTVWAILSPSIEDYSTNRQSEWYEEYSGVKVHWINVPARGWADAFQKSVMDGEFPDIYLYEFSTTEVQLCADYGAIIPLNDLIDNYCPNISQALDDDPALRQQLTSPDGNIYTLYSKSYNRLAYTQKLWVNREWLGKFEAETGIAMPSTTEEFRQMLEFFKNNDMNGNGDTNDEIPYMGCVGVDGVYSLFDAFTPCNSSNSGYGCYRDGNGDLVFAYDTDEFRDGIRYVNSLYNDGLFSDQSFTISSDDRMYYTSSEDGVTTVGVVSAVNASNIVMLSENGVMDYDSYVAIPPLKGPGGCRSYVTSGEDQIVLHNAITAKCENPELAAKWLDYWYSEEGRLWSVNGGLEGIDWEYTDGTTVGGNGQIVRALADNGSNASWAGQGVAYMISKEDALHMDASNIGKNDVLATFRADLEYSKYHIDSGWPTIVWITADEMDIAQEFGQLYSLVESHVRQSYTDFILGNKDINNDAQWNAYLDELKNVGTEKYLEMVDRYMSSKQ